MEEFKNCVSENIVVYLNEQKVSSLSQAAVFADEFVLTHKVVFQSPRSSHHTVVAQSFILADVLPFSSQSSCKSDVFSSGN